MKKIRDSSPISFAWSYMTNELCIIHQQIPALRDLYDWPTWGPSPGNKERQSTWIMSRSGTSFIQVVKKVVFLVHIHQTDLMIKTLWNLSISIILCPMFLSFFLLSGLGLSTMNGLAIADDKISKYI